MTPPSRDASPDSPAISPDPESSPPAAASAGEDSLYRLEALLAYRQGSRANKRSQWLDPSYDQEDGSRGAFYALIGLVLAVLVALPLIPVHDRVTGEAVVHLESGEEMASDDPVIHILVPDARRPALEAGQKVRLVFDAMPARSLEARVTAIGDEIVLPSNRSSVLGESVRPANLAAGPLAIIEARPVPSKLTHGGEDLALRHGMRGRAEVFVTSTSLLVYLVPQLGEPGEEPEMTGEISS